MIYRDYEIDSMFGYYTVFYEGDEVAFSRLEDAKNFIDSLYNNQDMSKKKLTVFTTKEFKDILHRNGYYVRGQKGSHMIFTNGTNQLALPVGDKEVNRYLSNDLIKKYKLEVK